MEVAGLALGAVGLAGQLLTASLAGYDVLTTAQSVGADFKKFIWRLDIEKHRLTKWGEAYKLSDPEYRQAMDIDEETLKHVVGEHFQPSSDAGGCWAHMNSDTGPVDDGTAGR